MSRPTYGEAPEHIQEIVLDLAMLDVAELERVEAILKLYPEEVTEAHLLDLLGLSGSGDLEAVMLAHRILT